MASMPSLIEKISILPRDKFLEIKPVFDRYFEAMMDYADAVEAYSNKMNELKEALAEKSAAQNAATDAENKMRSKLIGVGSV